MNIFLNFYQSQVLNFQNPRAFGVIMKRNNLFSNFGNVSALSYAILFTERYLVYLKNLLYSQAIGHFFVDTIPP